jgi:hypothetical protein
MLKPSRINSRQRLKESKWYMGYEIKSGMFFCWANLVTQFMRNQIKNWSVYFLNKY